MLTSYFQKSVRRNEVLAREGIDTYTESGYLPMVPDGRNEVLAREGIDTAQILNASEKCSESRNEVLAREGIDTSSVTFKIGCNVL